MKILFNSLLVVLLNLFSYTLLAQDEGALEFKGNNFYNSKELTNTIIKVVSDNKTITEFNTKNSHKFKTELNFGRTYDIYFINPKAQIMFIRVNTDIPQKARKYFMTYELDIPFFPKDGFLYDTTKFRNPFHQIVFDGKNKFVDDTTYMNNFLNNIYKKEEPKDTTAPFITAEKIKEYVQLAGKLKLDNDKQTALKNKTVNVKNKNGDIIATSLTTENGMFVFQHIDLNDANSLSVNLSDAENPTKAKVKLYNSSSEPITLSTNTADNYFFNNSATKNIIKEVLDQNYKYNIAGKLIASNGANKKVAAEKTVYLLNDKNNVVQKVKTNMLGNFLFTKIVPGQKYTVAFDSAEAEPGYLMNLYSTKDKFIKKLDSISNNRFVYRFLSVSSSSFNDLLIDDSDIKMNVKGRLYGNNKNNPLANIKVLLLNDKYETIDTATTNKNGDFLFKNVPFTKQIIISADSSNSLLEAFNNILVYDNDDNLIKFVSMVKGNGFKYRPLPTEQSKLSELFVDDPWMKVVNKTKKDTKASETIIENILFEFNKSELLPQSQQTLDKVVIVMQANQDFFIELSAHSDSKGSDAYNLKLSQERATSARNYIISKGIDGKRIKAIGYGETKLLNNCGNNSTCSDDEHAVNRRLEFKLNFN